MDIAALSIGMNQVAEQNSVQIAVMNMAMGTSQVESTNMVDMINSSYVDPDKGQNIDTTV